MNTVEDLMTPVVICGLLDYSLEEIEWLMDHHKLHFLPIIDASSQCVCVVSSSDLVHWHNIKQEMSDSQAWEVCSKPVIEVSPDLPLMEAVELMVSNNIQHLVVCKR